MYVFIHNKFIYSKITLKHMKKCSKCLLLVKIMFTERLSEKKKYLFNLMMLICKTNIDKIIEYHEKRTSQLCVEVNQLPTLLKKIVFP